MHGDPRHEQEHEAVREPRRSAARLLLFAVPVALLLLAGLALLFFAHSEPTNAVRGSLGYTIGIPGKVKDLPVMDDCAQATYSYTARDGERPGAAQIDYGSTLSKADIRALYSDHFDALNCDPAEDGARCGDENTYSVRIDPAASGTCRSVEIFILGDFS